MGTNRPRRRCAVPYCPRPALDKRPRCNEHTLELDATYQRRRDIYNTPQWRALSRTILDLRPLCQQCHRAPSAHVDHVTALEHGGDPWAETNLEALCHRCHSRKTAREVGLGRPVPAKVRPRRR